MKTTLRAVGISLLLALTAHPAATAEPFHFAGPDGRPLPFESPADAEAFLREARVIGSKAAPGGVTGARKLLLEMDGVQAHAIFRTVARTALVQQMPNGRVQPYFRDHYVNEVAAYALARLLGLDTVPPTVAREIDGHRGSLQLWIEGAETEKSFAQKKLAPQDRVRHSLQLEQMQVFDNLIHNIDRNLGNYLTDASGRVWYVDHTRSFLRLAVLPQPRRVVRVEETFWNRLREASDATVTETLAPYLPAAEVRALLERRRLVVARLEARLEHGSPSRVLFARARVREDR